MKIIRYDMFPVIPPSTPPRTTATSDGDGEGFILSLALLLIVGAYCFGYAQLSEFIGLSAVFAGLLFVPFTLVLTYIPVMITFGILERGSDDAINKANVPVKERVAEENTKLSIEMERIGGVSVATTKGRIDPQTAREFKEMITQDIRQGEDLVVDMRGVSYISALGLRALLMLTRQSEQCSSSLVFVVSKGPVLEILKCSAFVPHIINSCESLTEAVTAVRERRKEKTPLPSPK